MGLAASSASEAAVTAFSLGTETDSSNEVLDAAIYGLGGAAAGALVGVAIGAMSKSERWTDVPRQRWSLSVGARRGIQVGVRFAL
ncbi:MAG: hypothetical protein ABFS34_04180 [Gemmatimonadota bacterium]